MVEHRRDAARPVREALPHRLLRLCGGGARHAGRNGGVRDGGTHPRALRRAVPPAGRMGVFAEQVVLGAQALGSGPVLPRECHVHRAPAPAAGALRDIHRRHAILDRRLGFRLDGRTARPLHRATPGRRHGGADAKRPQRRRLLRAGADVLPVQQPSACRARALRPARAWRLDGRRAPLGALGAGALPPAAFRRRRAEPGLARPLQPRAPARAERARRLVASLVRAVGGGPRRRPCALARSGGADRLGGA